MTTKAAATYQSAQSSPNGETVRARAAHDGITLSQNRTIGFVKSLSRRKSRYKK